MENRKHDVARERSAKRHEIEFKHNRHSFRFHPSMHRSTSSKAYTICIHRQVNTLKDIYSQCFRSQRHLPSVFRQIGMSLSTSSLYIFTNYAHDRSKSDIDVLQTTGMHVEISRFERQKQGIPLE